MEIITPSALHYKLMIGNEVLYDFIGVCASLFNKNELVALKKINNKIYRVINKTTVLEKDDTITVIVFVEEISSIELEDVADVVYE